MVHLLYNPRTTGYLYIKDENKKVYLGSSLAAQLLGFCTFIAEGSGSIPGQGTKVLQSPWHGKKKKKKYIFT